MVIFMNRLSLWIGEVVCGRVQLGSVGSGKVRFGYFYGEILDNAGARYGIGDYRPRFGRFQVTKWNEHNGVSKE